MYAMRDLSAMVAETSASAIVSREDDMAEVMMYFDGPFVGMGITGHNDFDLMRVSGPVDCAEECAKTSGCVSFDYGAKGMVMGECWLSRADRKLAGHAYEHWPLYNYYELKMESAVSPAPSATVLSSVVAKDKDTGTVAKNTAEAEDTPTEVKKEPMTRSRPSLGDDSASSARRLSSMPLACVQAVVAIALFLGQ
jgi:hypothetical protein